ncbi:hypothetical protein [Flavobacterium nackdongense]|uniref:Uncharacterized protein n=1 Tax=Flavobacterium nackdongense TaxID=2547394 RepID=A0A4P6YFN4_9FLAO|nr:hypothetical protein [Flavobacterium nackdongense]QBN19253.1 hypothetical protein E1750_10715 [Flavobacterium nackdongense]
MYFSNEIDWEKGYFENDTLSIPILSNKPILIKRLKNPNSSKYLYPFLLVTKNKSNNTFDYNLKVFIATNSYGYNKDSFHLYDINNKLILNKEKSAYKEPSKTSKTSAVECQLWGRFSIDLETGRETLLYTWWACSGSNHPEQVPPSDGGGGEPEPAPMPPSCQAFNYSTIGSNWQSSATKNIVAVIGYRDLATGAFNAVPILFPQPIYFEMPINSASNGGNVSPGRAAELTALALGTAINRAKYYFLATDASQSQVQAKLWEYIRDEMTNGTHVIGGRASFTPPLGFSGEIKDYEAYWFLPDDCD